MATLRDETSYKWRPNGHPALFVAEESISKSLFFDLFHCQRGACSDDQRMNVTIVGAASQSFFRAKLNLSPSLLLESIISSHLLFKLKFVAASNRTTTIRH